MEQNTVKTMTIDGRQVQFADEPNLLAVIRRAEIELPTFCYHSELSVYGACRLCIVEVEGRGVVTSCSTAPEPGLQVRTNSRELRAMRKINIELLLAGHRQGCPTCAKSDTCKLLDIARKLGVDKVRFREAPKALPLDDSGLSLVRDPNKCVLCGDCVRFCGEVQGVGAIDFAHRGARAQVGPAFGKNLDQAECVNCGQCAAVCPTGAIVPKSQVAEAWEALHDPEKTVVVQIAPAVRVAVGEAFGWAPGRLATGQTVAGLKRLGFDQVFDTAFAADLTIVEEATELFGRLQSGERLPQFTSCCPAWVKFAEQYHPGLLPRLSTCRSPQQMFGAVARQILPEDFGIKRENLVVVSIMPCTAKKFEAARAEFRQGGQPDVDYVLTTQELARMIKEAGIRFADLEPRAFDMPLGFKTGAGVIFANTGGVTEAALRYLHEKLTGEPLVDFEFHQVRGNRGLLEAELELAGRKLRAAIVFGLANARALAERVEDGTVEYDFVEVMACPNGCVGGAGQPVAGSPETRALRQRGVYDADELLQLHKSQDNPYLKECYRRFLEEPGSPPAHRLLHTEYRERREILS